MAIEKEIVIKDIVNGNEYLYRDDKEDISRVKWLIEKRQMTEWTSGEVLV